MCGIAGIIDPTLSREQGDVLIKRMLESIHHRGPDNSSRWIDMPVLLGHNRLKIIDLSNDANQPMEFGDLVFVYDGKVYNYPEIRDELIKKGYTFRTKSDTEVVLAAYKEWGGECVNRFVGMWAFAIWDKMKRELFCSRDRFGIKPFYYIHEGNRFYFGSEYKPLKLSPLFSNRLNEQQIRRGLLAVVSYRDESYFEFIKVLSERSNLLFKNGSVSVTEYWDLDSSMKFHGSFEDKKHRFLELFRDSMRLHMRSEVEVGACLSGGLDSSAIASVVSKDHGRVPFKTFTIYYKGKGQMDERNWVAEVLKAYPHIDPIYCSPSDEELTSCFDRVIRSHDIPIVASSVISYYFVMQAAACRGMKVMLGGEGADAYLAGVEGNFTRLIAAYLKKLRLLTAWRVLNWPSCRRHGRLGTAGNSLRAVLYGERRIYDVHYRRQCAEFGFSSAPEFYMRKVEGSPLKQFCYRLLFATGLPMALHYQDRMAMLFSIENRSPFLDHRLIEFVHSLEDEDLMFLGQTKYILRASLKHFLPPAISARSDKQALVGGEMSVWLNGPLRFLLEKPFDFDRLSMLNPQKTTSLIKRFKDGDHSRFWLVWRLAALNYWMETQ
jgi:asparagine synthase (glutamine-hydrolysing)